MTEPVTDLSGRHVVVVGAGITGLATAYRLTQGERPPAVTVFEADARVGGKILTTPFAGQPAVDEGGDAYLVRVPWAGGLARELGLGDTLTSPATSGASIWHGRMHPIPEGLLLGVPAGAASLARGSLLTWPGKLRAAVEPLLPRTAVGPDPDHDNIGTWVRARFGDQVHELLVDPLVGSIYGADTDHFSLGTVPQLADLARDRSALLGARRRRRAATAGGPIFEVPRAGMGALVGELTARLGAAGVTIRTGSPVASIEPCAGQYRVDGIDADAVVIASPARPSAAMVRPLSDEAAALMSVADHAGVVMITLRLAASELTAPLPGTGYLVPKPDQRTVTAVSFGSNKWAHWRPADGSAVLRVSLGRDGLVLDDWDDERLLTAALDETASHLRPLLRSTALSPTEVRISRWPGAFPQYRPGHLQRVERLERVLADAAPGVVVAGASHRGMGVPACVQQAGAAAEAVRRHLAGMPG
jgi:oxygen-dependent protoporphyrinogen oxidase